MEYSTGEICKIFNISYSRLGHYRNGYKSANKYNKVYEIEPILIKGIDWEWREGKAVYFESAIEKIKDKLKNKNQSS